MTLSILIPVYNGETYIERGLNGILRQNLNPKDYEIIIVDDGSTDNTYEKAKEFEKKYNQIKVFTQRNMGLFNTRNKLLGMANGEYIYNLDVDDVLISNRLSYIVEFAIEKNLDFVGFKSIKKKEIAKSDVECDDLPISRVYEDGEHFLLANPNHRVEVWWYLIKRSFISTHNFSFEDNQNNADVLFTYQVLLKAKSVGYFDWLCHLYYQSPDSIMRTTDYEKEKLLVGTMHKMILSLGRLAKKVALKNDKKEVSKLMGRRMQQFAFGNLSKMLEIGLDFEFIQMRLKELKPSGAYPFRTKDLYLSKKLKLFAILVNSSFFLFLISQFFRFRKSLGRF